ncbi:MAG: PAS domain S-box protein [Brevundimonas sp.]|nr:PAS domain S-box protein [Brevundimonas sp.]
MAGRIRAFDWSRTPLGALPDWPQSLRTAVGMLVAAPNPMVLLWGPEGVLIYNDGYARFAGRRHPDLLGMGAREGWPEIADFNDSNIRRGLAGEAWSLRNQQLELDRAGQPEPVWMDLDYGPVPDESGRPAGLMVFVTETTERVQAERRQTEANDRLQLALSAGRGIGAWDWDIPGDRVYSDDRFARLYGVPADKARNGAPIGEFFSGIHPDDLPRVQGEIETALATGGVFSSEYRLVQSEGGIRWVTAEGRCVMDSEGRPLRFPGVSFDITDQRRLSDALIESESRYRALFDNIDVGFCIIRMVFDADGKPVDYRFIEVNPAFESQTGLTNAAGRLMRDLSPTHEQHWFDAYGAVATTGRMVRFEQGAAALGRWWDVHAYRVGDASDALVALLFTDITERKRTEMQQGALIALGDALSDITDPVEIAWRASRALGQALGASRVGYGSIDPDAGTILVERDWTAEGQPSVAGLHDFHRYGDYVPAVLGGESVTIRDVTTDPRTAPDPEPLLSYGIRALMDVPLTENGRVVSQLLVHSDAPRDWAPEEVAFVREFAERTRAAIARRQAEAEAQDSEARYRTLFDTMDEGFCIIEFFDGPHGELSDYIHVEANAAYAANAGIPDVVGQKLREMVGDDADEWVRLYRGVLTSGQAIRFEKELTETGRWLELSAFRVEPQERKQVAVLFKDLTARKRAEEALQTLNATLEERVEERTEELKSAHEALRQSQKMEAVGQLTGGIAHDFNNLLAGISGSLELLQRRLHEGRLAGVERYIDAAQGASQRAAALTQRLLAFSRRQTLDPKPVAVNRLINGMEDLIRRTVGPDIEVEVVGAAGLWTTRVDPSQLENALLNLCINARDAMAPNPGRLTIETANKWLDDRGAKERELVPGQYISLCVTDTGSGIPSDIVDKIFDPFFTTKPIGQGTGLGLSMIHGFVRQSGGQVRVYSEPDKGTTMCLYLPRYTGDLDAVDPLDPVISGHPGHGETVLLIDDEPTVRMLAAEVLGDAGYTVIEAVDGPSGLQVLNSGAKIDLLVTDVGLPGGLNGRQVADAARVARPDLKVLFITGYAENAAVGNGLLEPGMAVLTKPFVMTDLINKVGELIDG